jgi:hypothetical protein
LTVRRWFEYINLHRSLILDKARSAGPMSFVCAISVSLRGGGILNVASVVGVCLDVNLNLVMVLIVRYDFIAHDGWLWDRKEWYTCRSKKKKSDMLKKKKKLAGSIIERQTGI